MRVGADGLLLLSGLLQEALLTQAGPVRMTEVRCWATRVIDGQDGAGLVRRLQFARLRTPPEAQSDRSGRPHFGPCHVAGRRT